jgi:hypothetical protein
VGVTARFYLETLQYLAIKEQRSRTGVSGRIQGENIGHGTLDQ